MENLGLITIEKIEYDNLREFKYQIEAGGVMRMSSSILRNQDQYLLTRDEAINQIYADKEQLQQRVDILQEEIMLKDMELKKMSVLQFLRWKR